MNSKRKIKRSIKSDGQCDHKRGENLPPQTHGEREVVFVPIQK